MDRQNESKGSGSFGRSFARVCALAAGSFALVWGAIMLPVFWSEAPLKSMANAINRGELFGSADLSGVYTRSQAIRKIAPCDATLLRSRLSVALQMYQHEDGRPNQTTQQGAYDRAYREVREVLACSPAESFAWLALFWLDFRKYGSRAENLRYLDMSYRASPNEAAVGFWRNRLVLALADSLPAPVIGRATDEFAKLVETERLYREAGEIYGNASPALQTSLLAAVDKIEPRPRQVFLRYLRDEKSLPKSLGTPDRPWN